MVTHDDQVYALGSNNNGCLGVGDLSASFEPRKIKELCNQGEGEGRREGGGGEKKERKCGLVARGDVP